MNFKPEKSDGISKLHERVADRIYDLLTSNGGLYIKIGELSNRAIALNTVIDLASQAKPLQIMQPSCLVPFNKNSLNYSTMHRKCPIRMSTRCS